MSFGAASWLLVLILPAAGAAWRWRRRVPAEAAPKLARVLISGRSVRAISESPRAGGWRLLVALVLTILALARPRWGGLERAAEEPAREIVIALDLSRSMRVPDMAPSRLARAHRLVGQLLDGLQGERVALVVFAGTGFVQVPLTSDYQIMREFLPALEPGYLPQGGSDYGAMLRAAEEAFSTDPRVDRYLFVLSDGGSTPDDWRGALPGLAERGVTMVSIGFGTEAGGDVPPLENEQSPARSRLERAPLQMLAHATGGIYRDAIDLDARQLLAETVEARIGWQRASAGGAEPRERYGWFLAPAIVFAALGLWREVPVRPRQRAIARRPGAPSWLVLATAAAMRAWSSCDRAITIGPKRLRRRTIRRRRRILRLRRPSFRRRPSGRRPSARGSPGCRR